MNKTILALSFSLALMLAATGCGGHSSNNNNNNNHHSTVVLYLGNSYSCDWTGYCCDDFSVCYSQPIWWIPGGSVGSVGSTGSTGSTGGTGSTGSTGSTGGTTGSTGSTGGFAGSTGGSTGSTGGSGSFGGTTGSTGSTGAALSVAACADLNGCVANAANFEVPTALSTAGFDNALSGDTKDTGLQSAQLQEQDQDTRAHGIAQQFSMDYSAALQLTKLADRVQQLNAQNGMTTEEREAITQAALGVANVSTDDVNQALTKMVQDKDPAAMDALMQKAATNLGMPSAAGLRDQILPALGIQF